MKTNHLKQAGIALLLLISFSSCGEEDVRSEDNPQADNKQEVYFEVNYVNFAWGKQLRGFIIDKNGNIRTYDNPIKWNQPDVTSGLSEAQMQENISISKLSTKTIPPGELDSYISKIRLIQDGHLSKPIGLGADQGETTLYAYRFDAEKRIYMPVLLNQTGDWSTRNLDASAITISSWLNEVMQNLK